MENILICVIASFNEPHFKELIKLRKKQFEFYNIPHLFLYDDPFPEDFTPDAKDIYMPKLELIKPAFNPSLNPYMSQRFLQLKNHIDINKYDYIIRINISTYINIKKLNEMISIFPKEKFVGGRILHFYVKGVHDDTKSPFTFCSGTCMIMSKDVFHHLINYDIHHNQLYESNDDVAISYLASKYIPHFTNIHMEFVETDSMPNIHSNALLYRVKHYRERVKEIHHWKFLLSIFDGL